MTNSNSVMKRNVFFGIVLLCVLTIGIVLYLVFRPSKQQLSNKYKAEIAAEYRAAGKQNLARDIRKLEGTYTKAEWAQIATAYQDGTIRSGSLSDDLLEKMYFEESLWTNQPLNGLGEICGILMDGKAAQAREEARERKNRDFNGEQDKRQDNPNSVEGNELPSWVYGTWSCTTPYGTETMRIDKNGIWSLSYGNADYGSYSYRNGTITAHFPNDGGMATTMPLDIPNRRIEYGGGYYWRKNSN